VPSRLEPLVARRELTGAYAERAAKCAAEVGRILVLSGTGDHRDWPGARGEQIAGTLEASRHQEGMWGEAGRRRPW